MSSKNYFYINSDYGYNKKDFTLIENFDTNSKNENKIEVNKRNLDYIRHQSYLTNKKKENNTSVKNNNTPANNFPLAWTCYKSGNEWVCPMRGDK